MGATTEADFTAADVSWDLEPLVDGQAEPRVRAPLGEAAGAAPSVAARRGAVAQLDAGGLATVMHELGAIAALVGRASSYANLRFSADPTDPVRGALLQRVEERATAVNT